MEREKEIPKEDREFKAEEDIKSSYDELLDFARKEIERREEEIGEGEKVKKRESVIEFEEVKIPGKWEEWEEGEEEKAQRNRERISGYVNYQIIKHPELLKAFKESKSYDDRLKNLIPKWNELGLEKIDPKFREKNDSFSEQLFNEINERAHDLAMGSGRGKFVLNPKQEGETFWVSTPLVPKTEDYIPELKENIKRKMNEICYSIKDEEKLERVLEDCKLGAKLHIGIFGKTALKEGDLVPAIDAFDYTAELKNPEIVQELKRQMEELKKSGEPEDREVLMKASKKLVEISRKEKEG